MSSASTDVKPDVKPDIKPTNGYNVFDIPVEEEELEVSDSMAQSKVWAMKVPRFLLERWERVNQGGVHLGTLVVDNSKEPPRITLKLPVEEEGASSSEPASKRARFDASGIPDEYEVVMPSDRVKNTFIFTEQSRTWVSRPGQEASSAKRKREKARPRLLSALDHEGSVRPIRSAKYLKVLEQRRLESEQSKRPIVQLDESRMTQAKLNQLASGFANASSTLGKGMVQGSRRVPQGERFARLERHELIDRLFSLFNDKPYWSITALKATLQQPDAWLREVLKDVAVLIKEGQYANMWELRENWKEAATDLLKGEPGKEEEDDDEDDLELVEV